MKTHPIDSWTGVTRAEPELTLVPAATPAVRARELFQQARIVALEQLTALQVSLGQARDLAQVVADGGSELYGPGPQDLARRLANELSERQKTLQALTERRAELLH